LRVKNGEKLVSPTFGEIDVAHYEVRNTESNEWDPDNSRRRFKTRPPADELFEEEQAAGKFVRLIRWNYGLDELRRANDPPPDELRRANEPPGSSPAR
jgi:hypothetical protein